MILWFGLVVAIAAAVTLPAFLIGWASALVFRLTTGTRPRDPPDPPSSPAS